MTNPEGNDLGHGNEIGKHRDRESTDARLQCCWLGGSVFRSPGRVNDGRCSAAFSIQIWLHTLVKRKIYRE